MYFNLDPLKGCGLVRCGENSTATATGSALMPAASDLSFRLFTKEDMTRLREGGMLRIILRMLLPTLISTDKVGPTLSVPLNDRFVASSPSPVDSSSPSSESTPFEATFAIKTISELFSSLTRPALSDLHASNSDRLNLTSAGDKMLFQDDATMKAVGHESAKGLLPFLLCVLNACTSSRADHNDISNDVHSLIFQYLPKFVELRRCMVFR